MEHKNIWEQVQENQARLNKCPLHDFSIDTEPERTWNKRFECVHCGGQVQSQAKFWYERGIANEKARKTYE